MSTYYEIDVDVVINGNIERNTLTTTTISGILGTEAIIELINVVDDIPRFAWNIDTINSLEQVGLATNDITDIQYITTYQIDKVEI